ncbi:MAG TPA: ankyrin repeat domain-containing protein [Gemmataceae bacterium]|nr:ankyrin repeat domain-containing protein [Gemmataceae bacterium]
MRTAIAAGLPLNDVCIHGVYPPLHFLAHEWNSTPAFIQLLIDSGAQVNLPIPSGDRIGETPLMLAADAGRQDIVNVLLAAGADVHATNRLGSTALDEAAKGGGRKNHTAVFRELLAAGAKPVAQTLLFAAWNGNETIIQLILDAGVDPNAPSRLGLPLQWAVGMDRIKHVKLLLNAGADPALHPPTSFGQFSGKSALELADEKQNPAMLALLNARHEQTE